MSTSRNKRKRPEDNPIIPAPALSSRRRSVRDQSGSEPIDATRKNEGSDDDGAAASSKLLVAGDKPDHAVVANAEQRTDNLPTVGPTAASVATVEASSDIIGGNNKIDNALGEDQNKMSGVEATDPAVGSSTTQQAPSTESAVSRGPVNAGETPVAAGQQPISEKARNTRQSRIRSMISHRKLLLDRTRQGRGAARKRIVDLTSTEPIQSAQNSSAAAKSTDAEAATQPLTERAKDEAERAEFERITRTAIQAAKRHRAENSDGVAQEKRSSVSLRRGSSVGKKMSAAISALVPGNAGSSSTAATAADAPTEPLHVPSASAKTEEPRKVVACIQPVPPARLEPAASAPVVRPKIPLAANISVGKKLKSATLPTQVALAAPQPAARVASASYVEAGHKRPVAQKTLKSSVNVAATSRAATGGLKNAAMPQHTGLGGGSTLPQNKLLANTPVVCPEARVLRERRNALRSKLDKILGERQKRIESEAKATSGSVKPSAKITVVGTQQDRIPERCSPFHLPRRRRTHWDDLLEEMRWMATDFIEERKWKASAARTLSSAVMSKRVSASLPMVERAVLENEPVREKEDTEKEESLPQRSATTTVATTQKKDGGSRLYEAPTSENVNSGRTAAKIISSMVYELNNCILRVGPIPRSDRLQNKALERHLKMRKALEKEHLRDTTATDEVAATKPGETMEQADNKMEFSTEASVEGSEEESKSQKENSFVRISNTIDEILKQSAVGKTSNRKSYKRKIESGVHGEGDDLALTPSQLEAIDFIEKRWDANDNPGATMTGPKSSGKTIAICSLLWKRRQDGAQLVVCSSLRVFKWMHELKRFQGLRVRAFGFTGGISKTTWTSNDSDAFEASDVIVCEYGAFNRMTQPHFSQLSSMVVDCRYPRGFLGSRWPSISDEWKDRDEDDPGRAASGTIPHELTQSSWWEVVVNPLANLSIHRVLIENAGRRLFADGFNDKSAQKQIELLALRAAFVLGPPIFAARKSSIKKRMVTWARKRSKSADGDTTSEIERVRTLLLEILDPLRCPVIGDGLLEDILPSMGEKLVSEVRTCELNSIERSEYDKCCYALRGALSASLSDAPNSGGTGHDVLDAVADALLRLRKHCVHSGILSLFEDASVRTRLRINNTNRDTSIFQTGDRMLYRKVADSSSQIDVEVASLLLERSPKFRELLSILRNECDYRIENEDYLGSFLRSRSAQRGRPSQDKKAPPCPKKVVILAALPEVQILVSLLLNSTGITHELLLRPSKFVNPSHQDITIDFPVEKMNATILSWAECQQALSRFNTPMAHENAESIASNVVIASAATIAADHGGLGVDLADVVISLDEDWSGRDELIMRSLVAGLVHRNSRAKDKSCTMMRLVCKSTCEETFLGGADTSNDESKQQSDDSSWSWPLDACGRFDAAGSRFSCDVALYDREMFDGVFAFPAFNVLKYRGRKLSEVLSTAELPPLLHVGLEISFLPRGNQQEGGKRSPAEEAKLLVSLIEKEHKSSCRFPDSNLMAITPVSLRCDALTRQDLHAISTRMFLRQFGKSIVPIHALSGSQRASTVATTDALLATPGGNVATAQLGGNSALLASWRRKELNCNPIDFASSLLRYKTDALIIGKSTKEQQLGNSDHLPPMRSNKFAGIFDALIDSNMHDGHQGAEGLVYFPPLFPRLLHCTIQARHDIEAVRGTRRQTSANAPASDDADRKRPAEEPHAIPSAKRSKTDDATPMAVDDLAILPENVENAERIPVNEYRVITEDEASHSDAATVLLDLNEDFGLAGIGAIPLPKDSAIASSGTPIDVSRATFDPDQPLFESDLLSDVTACDLEELETARHLSTRGLFMNSMILFVARNKPRTPPSSLPAGLYRNAQNVLGVDPQLMPVAGIPPSAPFPATGNGAFNMNGAAGSAKKPKKKTAQTPLPGMPSSAFSRLPSAEFLPLAHAPMSIKASEVFRNRLFSFMTSRQRNMGVTLFETPAYHIAVIRLRNRIIDRMPHQCWTSSSALKVGPGLPLLLAKQATTYSGLSISEPTVWTSVVKRLKNQQSKTGDDAVTIASTQRSALRRSLVAPCRVDFGPFGGGFLASLSGMTAISPPRSRIGVSLPMGVKVPHSSREHPQQSWWEDEDRKLRESAVRFNMNWIFASRAVSGFEDIATSSTRDRMVDETNRPRHRSARQCRDRWQILARHDPTLAKEVRKSERDLREKFLTRPSSSLGENNETQRLDITSLPQVVSTSLPPAAQRIKMGSASVQFLSLPNTSSTVTKEPASTKETTGATRKSDEESKMEIDSVAVPKSEAPSNAVAEPKLEAAPNAAAPVESEEKPIEMDIDGVDGQKAEVSTPNVAPPVRDDSKTDAATMDTSMVETSSNAVGTTRRSFGALASAKAKTRVIPISIPGVVTGSPPSFVASHPSHLQSVQTSVAATWSNGRTEMWPLQFLDVVEKHRAAQAGAAAPPVAPAPNVTSAPSASRAAAAASARPHSAASNTTASTSRTQRASGGRSSSASKPKNQPQRGSASFPQIPPPSALPPGAHHPSNRVAMTPSSRSHRPPQGQPHYPPPTPMAQAQQTPARQTRSTPSPKKSGARSTKKAPPPQPKPPPST